MLAFAWTGGRTAAQDKPEAPKTDDQSKARTNLKPLPHDEGGRESVEEGAEFLKRRQDWFFRPRAFPLGFIPQGARERALQQMKLMYQKEGRLALRGIPREPGSTITPSPTASPWFSIGPQGTVATFGNNGGFTSGRVTALAVNPNNPSNIYLGGADGGLWITTDAGVTWHPLTDFPVATGLPTVAVGALALDPTSCSATICTTVYVGTGEDNFGADNIYGEGVLKCTVSAVSPPTAACSQDSTFHLSALPLTTTRGGPLVGALAVNRATGKQNILLAAVRGLASTAIPSGAWCSSDAGVTWTRVLPAGANSVSAVPTDVAFGSDGTAWVAMGFPFGDATNNGIYRSNAPVTACTGAGSPVFAKQTLPAGLSNNIGRITLAVAPSSNDTVYAAIADSSTTSSNLLGVAKTTNGTAATPTWTQLNGDPRLSTNGICNSQCFYDIPLAVSPANANTVFFGGAATNGTLIRSTDGGNTWTEISRNDVQNAPDAIHVDMHAIAFSNNGSIMYVGNDGGIWKAAAPTGAPAAGFWTNLNQDLTITQFYPGVSIHPANRGFGLAGAQDNGLQIYQGFNGVGSLLTWNDAGLGCDGGFTAIDQSIPSTSYGECEYIPNRPPFPIIAVTFNGDGVLGNGFLANVGINPADRGGFIPPLIVDPNTTTTLYFGTCRVWLSADGANSWNAISPDVTSPAHAVDCSNQAGGVLTTVAPAPGNSNIIYVASETGDIEVTSNGGTAWASIANGLPTRAVTQVVVDPATPATAYAAFSGFGSCANAALNCDGRGHVFKTANGTAGAGTTWTDISIAPFSSTPLPDIPVNAMVVDPADATRSTLYVGTDIGAFFTTDGGLHWSPLGAAGTLPNAQILSLTLHAASHTLRAATHGRGIWDLNLGGQAAFGLTSVSPFSANAGAGITNLAVSGNGFTATSVVTFTQGTTTTNLATTFNNGGLLTATIPVAQLQNGVLASIRVSDPAKANPTNAVPFTVLAPIPAINTISPTTILAGTTNFSLTANGNSIQCGTNGTALLFNGFLRTNVTACSQTALTVKLPDADLATAAVVTIDLFTPQPGGGPDTNGTPPQLTITAPNNPLPTVTTLTPNNVNAGSAQFPLTVMGTGFVSTSVVNFNGVAKATAFVSATQLTATILATDVATAATVGVTVTNPTPGGGTSTPAVNFTINAVNTGSFTVTVPAAQAIQAGNTVMVPVTVHPAGGFTGGVTVNCQNLPPGATCNGGAAFVITVPNGNGNTPVVGQLPIAVLGPSTVFTASVLPERNALPNAASKDLVMVGAGTGFAALLLLFVPGRKRLRAALGLGLVCVISLALGCGGGYGGGGTVTPVATTTHLTLTPPAKQPSTAANFVFAVAVAGGSTPTGNVQLLDGGANLGATSSLSNGAVMITENGLTPVGTHAISVHYLGDAGHLTSSSGAINCTVTGPATVTIAAQGATNGNQTLNVTIN